MNELGNLMIDGLPIAGLTSPALLGLAIFMLLKGKLWTNEAYQDQVKEKDRWRAAYEIERERAREAESQSKELLELAKTTHALITGVFRNSEHIRRSGELP